MIDINLIRENPEKVRTALLRRMEQVDFSELLRWDKERRELVFEIDKLREKKNSVSSKIPLIKKEGRDVTKYVDEMKTVSNRIKSLNAQLVERKEGIRLFLETLPNIPDDDVPEGREASSRIRTPLQSIQTCGEGYGCLHG